MLAPPYNNVDLVIIGAEKFFLKLFFFSCLAEERLENTLHPLEKIL